MKDKEWRSKKTRGHQATRQNSQCLAVRDDEGSDERVKKRMQRWQKKLNPVKDEIVKPSPEGGE